MNKKVCGAYGGRGQCRGPDRNRGTGKRRKTTLPKEPSEIQAKLVDHNINHEGGHKIIFRGNEIIY